MSTAAPRNMEEQNPRPQFDTLTKHIPSHEDLIVQEKSIKVPSCLPQKASPQTLSSESKSKRKSRPKRKVPFLPFSLLSLLPDLGPTLIYTYAGGGKGKWSAYKSGEMACRYEDRGRDYEDTGDNKTKAQKGAPKKK
jgi:hypothetical protein